MRLEALDLGRLEPLPVTPTWGGDAPAFRRRLHQDARFVYKLWERAYIPHRLCMVGPDYRDHPFADPASGLAAIDAGLIDAVTCPAFVDLIVDAAGVCRGYVTRRGRPCAEGEALPWRFAEAVFDRCARSGHLLADFKAANVVVLDGGRHSLIDLDGPLAEIASLDEDLQRREGVLRASTEPVYAHLVRARLGFPRAAAASATGTA